MRSYSLSSPPGADGYRISVKHEPHGPVSGYLTTRLRPGRVLDVAAPRGDFILDRGNRPGAAHLGGHRRHPGAAMLHELAARRSDREVWWIHGDRGPREQALAAEARCLLASLPHAHEQVCWSRPDPPNVRTALRAPAGSRAGLAALGVPRDADAYICGPASFMTDVAAPSPRSASTPARIHTELFGALAPINPGSPARPPGRRTSRRAGRATGPLVDVRPQRPPLPFGAGYGSLLELADACDVPTAGAAGPGSATPASRPCSPAISNTARSRSSLPPRGAR